MFNLKEYDESETAYRHAVEAEQEERQRKERKERPEAWLGLLNLYEEQKRVDQYIDAAVRVAGIWKDQYGEPLTAVETGLTGLGEQGRQTPVSDGSQQDTTICPRARNEESGSYSSAL